MRIPAGMCLLALVVAAGPSCGTGSPSDTAPAAAVDGHRTDADEGHGAHGAVTGAGETSDLDRPVEALTTPTCEHRRKTYECDECRYEVGFVRVCSALTEGGLLTTAGVERRKVTEPVALTGEIRFDDRRIGHVSSQVEGVIRKVHVALGDRVATGQPLIEIESVTIGDDQAAFRESQGLLALARRNFERTSELRRENISSEREFFQAKQDLEAAEIRAAAARSRLARLGAGGGRGGRVVLRAPVKGTVLAMHAVPGEIAATGESLVTVGDNTSVWVWADLYEGDIGAVKSAQEERPLAATISVKAYPGAEFPGIVDLISPAMDESSRTVKVRIAAENHDGRLLDGMFAAIELALPGIDDALAVPRAAVLEDEGRPFVFVHYQGEYWVRRPVTVGRTWSGWVEIGAGLEPGQIVAAEGAFLMKSDVLRSKMGAGCAD